VCEDSVIGCGSSSAGRRRCMVAPRRRRAEISEALVKAEGIIGCGRVVWCRVSRRMPYGPY
jgi:hypothetical protein